MADTTGAADIADTILARLRAEHPAEADEVLGALVVGTLIAHLAHPEGGQAFAAAVNLRLAEAASLPQRGANPATVGGRVWQLVELGADQVQRLRQVAGAAIVEGETAPRQ